MSWWDTKNLTSFASQAIKSAQEQIDKVLDIDEKDEKEKKSTSKEKANKPASSASSSEEHAPQEEKNSWNSWNSWISPKSSSDDSQKEEAQASGATAFSSWNFSWGSKEGEDSKVDTASLKSSSKTSTATTKSSAAVRKVSKQRAEANQKVFEKAEFKDSETELLKDRISKEGQESGEKSIISMSRPEPAGESSFHHLLEGEGYVAKGATSVVEPSCSGKSEGTEEKSASEFDSELQPDNFEFVKTESSACETLDTVPSDTKQDVIVTEFTASKVPEVADISFVPDSAPVQDESNQPVQEKETEEKDVSKEEENLDTEDSRIPTTESGQSDSETCLTQSITSSGDAPTVCDSSEKVAGSGGGETLETVTEEVDRQETLSQSDSDVTLAGLGSDTMVSGEGSFANISSSEDLQGASITSLSSEPILLSMSTEDSSYGLAQEEQTGLPENEKGTFSLRGEEEEKSQPGSAVSEDRSSLSSPQPDSTATVSSNESSETSRLDSSIDTVIDRCQHSDDTVESTGTEGEEKSHGPCLEESDLLDFDASHSPSASFVKCMIEDAMGMDDSTKHEDSSSDNHSEEKSESSKVDSEFEKSIYSGHESSDEIETTTSSDIEIISTPTPNGEKNIVDLSPLKFSLQKAARGQRQGHHRSDSQSSSSTHSKADVEQLSLERDSDGERHEWHREGKGTWLQGLPAQHDDLDNPQHPQRLLKSSKTQQEKDVAKKLAEMAEVLQARESKLVQLSKDNNDLLETNSILRSQLQQAEEARDAEMTDLNALTEEFTRRMGESERKMQTVLKEKEAIKQQLQLAQSELAKRSEDANLEAMLIEKDEQITGLMEEGEKLSKQQLQNSNIIKKLRNKEKENEKLLASQKTKIDQQKEELDKLKVVLDSKVDMEKKQADAIKQLNAAVQTIEKEKNKLKVENDVSDEKIRGLQATLDNSYKEIAELHKSNASQDSRAQQAALSAEMQVREELKMAMEEENQQHGREKEALVRQIEDLRLSLTRMEKDHNRREEIFKQEIADLQMRLQEDESRSQDLTHSVTTATRPLLRQIENLQATHSIQSAAWEKVERSLTDRLSEAQTVLALAQEKERLAVDKLAEVSSRCVALESSNSQLRQEKAQLSAQQDSDRRRIDMLEERKANEMAQLELAKQKLSEEVANIRKDKVFLEQQLETERKQLEMEKQRVSVAEEQIRMMERERPRSRGTPSPVSVSRQESMNSSFSERSSTPTWLNRQEESEGHFMLTPGPKTSLYDSMRHSGAAALMENLQSQLKLREGEISQLQAEIQQLERTRESMARELVNLTNLNEELQENVKELPKVREEQQELNSRYSALLQMYGEKEEKVQELMLDLEDVKDMYKQQINALMK